MITYYGGIINLCLNLISKAAKVLDKAQKKSYNTVTTK